MIFLQNTYICIMILMLNRMKISRKSHLLLTFLLLFPLLVAAQQVAPSALKFESATYDYGHIAEDGGSVLCRFEAENLGEATIEIVSVIATCGCTSMSYDRRPIAPGERFSLQVRFDPMNRPGRIDKQVYVETSDSEDAIVLHLTGYVIPRERSVEEIYPFDMGGGLRLDSNFRAFGYVEHGKSVELRIGYRNTTGHTIELSLRHVVSSEGLSVEAPAKIQSQASGDIVLRYVLDEDSQLYGTLDDRLEVWVDGRKSDILLTTNAIAVDNFDSVDDISAPRADISKNIIKFGEVNCTNVILTQSFELTNVGESPLVIRSIEPSDSVISCGIKAGRVVAPGATLSIVVELNPSYIEDRDNPYVGRLRLVTNDPIKPLHTVRVSALPN